MKTIIKNKNLYKNDLDIMPNLDKNKVTKNKYGKLYYPDYYFNISHKDNILVCSIHNKETGIDVENIKGINNKIVKYLNEDIKDNYTYTLNWVLKESYLKCLGTGIQNIEDLKINLDFKNYKYTIIHDRNYIIGYCYKK